jgi:hypothetical protein
MANWRSLSSGAVPPDKSKLAAAWFWPRSSSTMTVRPSQIFAKLGRRPVLSLVWASSRARIVGSLSAVASVRSATRIRLNIQAGSSMTFGVAPSATWCALAYLNEHLRQQNAVYVPEIRYLQRTRPARSTAGYGSLPATTGRTSRKNHGYAPTIRKDPVKGGQKADNNKGHLIAGAPNFLKNWLLR